MPVLMLVRALLLTLVGHGGAVNAVAAIRDSQSGALGLMSSVVGGASSQGIDPDTAASTASTVSSLLDASLFSGGGDADTTESQRDMLDLTMTNAWSATTTASTRTRHRGTEELSEI